MAVLPAFTAILLHLPAVTAVLLHPPAVTAVLLHPLAVTTVLLHRATPIQAARYIPTPPTLSLKLKIKKISSCS